MSKITAIVITKNEEKTIKDCLRNLNFVNHVIVVDSYSQDRTREIVEKAKAQLIMHQFRDFSETRNFALSKAKTEWVLYIDADEQVSEELKHEIQNAIKDSSVSAYSFMRRNYYLGREWPYKEKVTKLFLRKNLIGWRGILHESPQFVGEEKMIKGELLHFSHRNLEEMLNKTIEWSEIEARLRFENNHPPVTWWRLIRVFITGFFNSYIKQQGYKVGTVGLIESIYQGYSMFNTYVRLWEMQKQQK